ncbi:MAG: hypothetical protein J6N45_08470 [Alphaproteobacteria bacterium]|nr:hypothetical protein [Alphaproteobacteria bacterium]
MIRTSTAEKPLEQAEIMNYVKTHKSEIFEVAKVAIDVELTKAIGGERVETNVLARDGRKVEETVNTAKEGQAIDTRHCINGDKDQYAKKPEKVAGLYEIEGGRSYDDVAPGETVKAKTVGGEQRKAFVAEQDMYINASWGEVQFVAKGGLVTISGNEAIGNNNPCDMVLVVDGKQGKVPMTENVFKIRSDLEKQGITPTPAIEKFFKVAAEEDRKNPYMQDMSRANTQGKGLGE